MARNDDYYDDEDSEDAGYYDGAYDDAVEGDASQTTGDDVARATGASDGRMVYADGREADDSWLTRGLATMLLVTGAILFLFPEPATSMVGIGLIVTGLVIWVVTGRR